jgi:hypothetical protein
MPRRLTGSAGRVRLKPNTPARCGACSRIRRWRHPNGKAGTPTCAGRTQSPTSAPGGHSCARGLGLARLKATSPGLWSSAFPAGAVDLAVSGFARYRGQVPSLRVYIQGSTWSVPVAWFVPFAPDERWLVLGAASDPGEGGRATASATRALVYATTMSQARQRVAWALAAVRGVGGMPTAGPGSLPRPDQAALRVLRELEQIGCWLAEFHPQGLVELDYGGLVHLLDDEALRADQLAAEASAAMGALARGELEMATAMYRRLTRRWGVLAALVQAS